MKGIRMIRRSGLALLMFFAVFAAQANLSDVIDDIATCVKTANTKGLTKYFSSTVSMNLMNDEGVYSRVQAEIILREFFNKNKPTNVQFIHRLDSNPNLKYVVLNLTTSRETFRVSYRLTNEDNVFKVTEFRIEPTS